MGSTVVSTSMGVEYYVVSEEHVCLHVVRLCAAPMSPHRSFSIRYNNNNICLEKQKSTFK